MINLKQIKEKFVYFDIFIIFMKLRLNFQLIVFISHVILLENLNETTKMIKLRKR